jgi:uncharacterized membrane protein
VPDAQTELGLFPKVSRRGSMIETIFVIAASILVALIMLPPACLAIGLGVQFLFFIFCGLCTLLVYIETLIMGGGKKKKKEEINPWR